MSDGSDTGAAWLKDAAERLQPRLTKREYFTGVALQGLLTNEKALASAAVTYAEAVLGELSKGEGAIP